MILQALQEELRQSQARYEREKGEMTTRINVLEQSVQLFEGLQNRVQALEESRNHPLPPLQLSDDPVENEFLVELTSRLPINSKEHMEDLEEKLNRRECMNAAVTYFEKYACKSDYNPFFTLLFGDWVTSNVTYQKPTPVSKNLLMFCIIFDLTLHSYP